jgi:hypothetical protein
MRKFTAISFLIAPLLITCSFAQTDWRTYGGNPAGTPPSLKSIAITSPN